MRPAMKPTPDRHGACRGQRGIAALEFSLTLTMLLMFICAVVGYGVLFWMQQQLAAAANEGARAAVFARFGRARREWRGLHGGDGRVLDRLRGGLRHHPRALRLERRGRTDGQLRHDLHDLQHPVLAGAGHHAGAHRHAARHEQGLDPVQIVFQSHRANLTRDTMSSLSKIIAGVLLAAGLVLAFVAWRLASAPSSPPQPVTPVAASAPAPQEPVKFYPVVVAAKAIPAGTRIAPDMLEVAKWQVACRAAFRRPTCSPARSCAPTSPWAIPLPSMLAHGMASLLQPGERALAVAVDEVSGGGNRILPGDFVDVFFMLDKSSEVQAGQARLLQSQLRVLAYGANSLDGPEEKSLLQQGAPAQPAKTAVLAVPVERVSELMLASRAGRLQLALRPLGDAGVPDIALFPQPRGDAGARRPDARTARAARQRPQQGLWRRHPVANGRHHAVAAPGRARVGRWRAQRGNRQGDKSERVRY